MKTTLFRNTFAAIAALFIALFALPQQAQAEDYNLYVANVQVTSANCNDLSVLPGVSGTASYDPATKTLYLENATIKTKRMNGIASYIDGLTIQVKGTVRVTSEELSSLYFNRPATITGGGTLNVTGENSALYADHCQVTIDGCTVNAKGKRRGIYGHDGTLIVRKANVTAEGSNYGSIYDLNNLALIGCAIAKPAGAAFNTSLKGVALNGQIVKKKVTIEPATTAYELFVAGTRVTSDNCDDLSVIPGVTGTAKYDPATRDLHLHDATITATGTGSGIASEIAGMSIRMTGTNSVTSQKVPAINFQRFGHIYGNGTLNVTSSENTAIFLKQSLDIGGGTVNAKGTRGIAGYDGTTEKLTVRNATVTAEGDGTNPSLCNLKTLDMQNCYVTRPSGAAFNAALKGVAQGGLLVKTKVRIGKQVATPYGLKIAGKQVNSDNAADLTELSGVTGTAYYDHATKTLTLENATIAATNHDNGIRSETDGLTVRVKGTVNVTAQRGSAINFTKSATITGGGTLNATSSENGGIYLKDDLTIDGCTVNVKGKWGISGDGIPATTTLTVRNANITTQGKIEYLKDLILEGCVINYPAGAVFDPSAQAVIHDGHFALAVKIGPPTYDLHIAGVQVTSLNAADLTVIPGVTGTVKYDPTTKTLNLQNATIAATGNNGGINSQIDGLTLRVTGTANITAQKSSALRLTRPATITGGGTLNTESSGDCGIYVYLTRLTIDGCTVNAKGEYGITGDLGHSERLTIRNANVTAECDGTEGSITAFKALTLEGCEITQPAGAAFDASLKGVALGGQLVKTKIVIAQPVATPYDLRIAGTQVTSANCANLSAIPGVTGTASYDPTTKTLTLQESTIAATGSNDAIAGDIDGLTIRVNGNVNITAQKSGISSTQPFTITGSATLNVTSNEACGIYVNETDLTIDGTTVNAKGTWGIAGQRSDVETLTLRNATVTAEGTNGSIIDFKALTLNGCAITQPAGAAFDAALKGIAQGGQLVKTKIVIGQPVATPYDLEIAGTQVTSANAADLTAIPGVTGTASYDPTTKTLNLQDATIAATGSDQGINSEIDGLTLHVTGTANITAQNNSALKLTRPATITGGGTLNITGNGDCGIYVHQTRLTIDGCTVNAKGEYGIAGETGNTETLTLRNATVTAEGTNGSIIDFAGLTLEGCEITQPAGAAFDASLKGIALGGQLVKEKVEIAQPMATPYNLLIAGKQVTSANAADLTAIPGVTGIASYDPTTKTLNLQDATIAATGSDQGINSEIDGLTLRVKGTVNVTTKKEVGISSHKPFTITGGGTLNVTASGSDSYGIYAYEADLTIDGCTVHAKGGSCGILGRNFETLTIRNATVTAESDGTKGSIRAFKALVLDGCAITSPAGAAFNASLQGVALGGALVKTKVEIAPLVLETYVVQSTDGKTLTFYHDTQRAARAAEGTVWGITQTKKEDGRTYPIWVGTPGAPNQTLTKAVFDPSFKDHRPTSTQLWFSQCRTLQTIEGLSNLNTEQVTDMGHMFSGCQALTTLDLSKLNTQNVTNMSGMFSSCQALTTLDLSKLNTQNVTTMSSMFFECRALTTLDLSKLNTQNVTYMGHMFYDCRALTTLDLSNFNTEQVTNMNHMFSGCRALTALDLSKLNTQNVTAMNGMFDGCRALTTLDLSKLNTQNVTDMSTMFYGCYALTTLDLSKLNTAKVTDMGGMFSGCYALTAIFCNDDWKRAELNSNNMFTNCTKLRGAVSFDPAKTDATMANPTTGYFTRKDAPTAIAAPEASEAGAKQQGTYTLHGVKLDAPLESLPAGVYIVNGKKVVKK